jgi:glucose/mannose-6-phosphate isomerase
VPVIPIPGGFQPRAAVGYSTVTALEMAAACGAAPSVRDEVEAAAALCQRLAAEWRPEGDDEAPPKALARRLCESVPVVAGAELTAGVAYRWKSQFNENAEVLSFASELPEVNHNEICGWEAAATLGPFAAVFLEDARHRPEIRRRVEFTARAALEAGVRVVRVTARGDTPLQRVLSAVLLGDLVSVYMAVLSGVDPTPVEAIARLKTDL